LIGFKIIVEEYALQRYFASADEEFFRICEKELAKINTFFAEKLAEAQRKFETLNNELNITNELAFERKVRMSSMNIDAIDEDEELLKDAKMLDDEEETKPPGFNRRRLANKLKDANNEAQSFLKRVSEKNRIRQLRHKKYKKDNDLKLAFSEFYLSLILLQNYQNLNYDGFRKILKKHDKVFKTSRGCDWRVANVETAPFHTIKKVDQFISEIENLFADKFENGDKQRAMKRLRVPPFEEKQSTWTTFRLGFYLGMIFILFPALIFICNFIFKFIFIFKI
jgi:SPX domain protein involved in polyphosphate accumulation